MNQWLNLSIFQTNIDSNRFVFYIIITNKCRYDLSGIDYSVYGTLFLVSGLGFDLRLGFDNNIEYGLFDPSPLIKQSMMVLLIIKHYDNKRYCLAMIVVNSMVSGNNYPCKLSCILIKKNIQHNIFGS